MRIAPTRRLRYDAAMRLRGRITVATLGAAMAMATLAGCQKPLFPANKPRTQFDRFDEVRNQSAPQYVEDEFGRRRPNITGRLEPKG